MGPELPTKVFMEDQLNSQSAAGGGFWNSLLGAAANVANNYIAPKTQKAGQPANTGATPKTTNWGLIAAIGGGVVLLVVILFAVKK